MSIIKLDIDYIKTQKQIFAEIRKLHFRLFWINHEYFLNFPCSILIFKTGKGLHIYISVDKDISAMQLCFLQAVLGSDWLRELRNNSRIREHFKDWNILFQEKYSKGKLQSKEKFLVEYSFAGEIFSSNKNTYLFDLIKRQIRQNLKKIKNDKNGKKI